MHVSLHDTCILTSTSSWESTIRDGTFSRPDVGNACIVCDIFWWADFRKVHIGTVFLTMRWERLKITALNWNVRSSPMLLQGFSGFQRVHKGSVFLNYAMCTNGNTTLTIVKNYAPSADVVSLKIVIVSRTLVLSLETFLIVLSWFVYKSVTKRFWWSLLVTAVNVSKEIQSSFQWLSSLTTAATQMIALMDATLSTTDESSNHPTTLPPQCCDDLAHVQWIEFDYIPHTILNTSRATEGHWTNHK